MASKLNALMEVPAYVSPKRDEHGRWRSKTIAFLVTPEENQLIDSLDKLSETTKQDYIIHRLTNRDVVITGNP